MFCVTTRFHLRTPFALLSMYRAYRRMQRDLEAAPGLVRHAFLLQSPLAVCTLSIWASREALERFANVPSHIVAVRHAKRTCRAIWSAYWALDAVSRYASEWAGDTAWPELVPDDAQPWRLVAPEPRRNHPADPSSGPQAVASAKVRDVRAWDWSRVHGVAN